METKRNMEIIFTQLDIAYNELSRERREEKYSEEDAEITRGFGFPPISLPYPLDEGHLIFRRNREIYSAHFLFWSKRKDIFKDSSRGLNKKFGDRWSQMNKNGVGYILEKDDPSSDPYISISSACKGNGRLIAIGSFGAKPLEVKSFEDFGIYLTDLEKITNGYIACCLSPLVRDSKIPPLPKHPIYISA